MEDFEFKAQESRLAIITWISFGIALICLVSFLSDLFTTPLRDYVENIYGTEKSLSEVDQHFLTYLKEIRFKKNLTNSFGVLISILFISSTLAIHFRKKWSVATYYLAIILAIIYNGISIYNIFISKDNSPMIIGGKPNSASPNAIEYLSIFAEQFQTTSSIIFFVLAMSYLSFNLYFFQNGKTKYILKELLNPDK